MTRSVTIRRSALLAASAMTLAFPAHAADELQRDYLGTQILVTAERDTYAEDDGSTATKTPTPLIDVPQAVSVITSDQIEDQGVHQLGDALRYVPGVSIESGEGHRDAVFIRGQSTTADFFLDGIRDDAQYYRPLYNVERIEVLKGPNALIFGRGGGGGAINRVSKTASGMEMFTQLAASVGTFGNFTLAADANQPLSGDVAARINATYEEFDNNRQNYEGRFIGISPTITTHVGPDTRLTVTYSYDDDERVTDRGLPSVDGLPLMGYDDTFFGDADFNDSYSHVHIARTRIDHDFSDAVSVNGTLLYANYDKFYANITPGGGTASTVDLVGYSSATQRENLFGQVNMVAQFETGTLRHTLLLGGELGDQSTDSTRNQALFDDGNGGTTSRVTVALAERIDVPDFMVTPQRASESDLSTTSFYIQEQLDIGILQLVGGVRYDRFDLDTVDLVGGFAGARVDTGWSPRFGAIVKPVDELSIYASYSESFLPQSGNQFSLLNPLSETLDPEGFENYELGVKYAVKPNLFLTAAVFRLDRTNSQAPDPENPGFIILAGESRVEGFEASLAGEIVENLQVNLSYTYLDGKITATTNRALAGTRLQQLPESQIGAWARYDVSEQFGLAAGVVHQSAQFASLSNNVVLPGYTRIDAALFFDVNEDFSLQLNIENLFDEDYYPSAHGDNNIQPSEPLNATIGARIRF